MQIYRAYGRSIESDIELDVSPCSDRSDVPLRVEVDRVSKIAKEEGACTLPGHAQGLDIEMIFHDRYAVLQVYPLFRFELWTMDNLIRCEVSSEIQDSRIQYWILQQAIPLFLVLSGSTEFLHGMAASTLPVTSFSSKQDLGCSGFLGHSGAGKSTLLKFFLAQGHNLVTDDHLALTRENYADVLPANPFYRPYRSSEDLGVRAENYSPDPTRLHRLYLLKPVSADAEVKIQYLTGKEAVSSLVPHIPYILNNLKVPTHYPIIQDRFRGLAELSRNVPIARLDVPRSMLRLPEVYNFLQKDLHSGGSHDSI